jgi:hypothetical protein
MSGKPKTLSSRAKGSYEQLVYAFEDACAKANCGPVKRPPISGAFETLESGEVKFTYCLYLKDWRAGAASTRKPIHILVRIEEKIRPSDGVLLSSAVQVDYYDVKDNTATFIQGMHFDYGPGEPRHPFFHAQNTSGPIELERQERSEIRFTYDVVRDKVECFKDARIPTSDMTFPSVLLCLAADHFAPTFFMDFRKIVCKYQEQMPQPNFPELKTSLAAESGHLRSSHWFAHMQG